MNITVENLSAGKIKSDVTIVSLFENEKLSGDNLAVNELTGGIINDYAIEKEKFKGKFGKTYMLSSPNNDTVTKVLIAGMGKASEFDISKLKELYSKTVKTLKTYENVSKVVTVLPEIPGLDVCEIAKALTESILNANYEFDKYKSDKKEKISEFVIACKNPNNFEKVKSAVEFGKISADCSSFTKNLVTDSPSEITPEKLAQIAKSLDLDEVKVYDDIKALKMGGFEAVSRGSANPPRFIHMKYTPENPEKRIVLIGKGITFDAGGLDLKPPASMLNMKDDMTGAATVLSIMKNIKKISPKSEVHALIAACENMPGCAAYKPGDILTARNGKTIEVDNTDAEGRITLADALSYACELKPDVIIDIATLTGACMVALGHVASGIMGNNDELVKKLIATGNKVGERFWEMPMFEEYAESIKSDVADMKNTGSRYGGASIAGLFLKNFVNDDIAWAHLDIAGTAFIDKPYKWFSKGSTGVAISTLVEYLSE